MVEFVYLTSSLGMALNHAIRVSERVHDGADVAIMAVNLSDLDERNLYADEDYINEESRWDFSELDLATKMQLMRRHKKEWKESLHKYKVVAYRGVVKPVRLFECSPLVVDDCRNDYRARRAYLEGLARKVNGPSPSPNVVITQGKTRTSPTG